MLSKYQFEFCRLILDKEVYSDVICKNIATQLEDDKVRSDLEFLIKHGYEFSLAVDTLVEDGRLRYL